LGRVVHRFFFLFSHFCDFGADSDVR
jgi:hypothetical protein